jgi:hypothetical protein
MSPKMQKVLHWVSSTVIAMLGGGAAAGFTAAIDPSKYNFPKDLGSGKLWPYVFMGWGLTFAGILVHSPIGQKVIAFSKQSQEQLEQTQKDLDKAKAALQTSQAKQNQGVDRAIS